MHRREVREAALVLRADGWTFSAISRHLGVSRAAIRDWSSGRAPKRSPDDRCFVCTGRPCSAPVTYAYLLGQYLGDGYLVTSSRVPRLRIACANSYPGIAHQVDLAMATLSGNRPGFVQALGCTDRFSHWMHWPCLFPRHGPGHKHERAISLTGWQQQIVDEHPWPLVRGLIHSDGCRATNRVTVRGKQYEYPRYFFANESADILAIMGMALDRVGVAWRFHRPNSISVARREAVALMDEHIGPKT